MSRVVGFCLAGLITAGLVPSAAAEDYMPRVSVTVKSANETLVDLEYLLKLTTEEEQEQWPVLQEYLDIFLIGIDRSKPMRVDALMGGDVERYISSFPVADFNEFRRDNLDTLGIESKYMRQTKQLYRLEGAFEGYMRYLHGYGIFAELKSDVPSIIPNPVDEIEPLVGKYDAAVWGRNQAEGQAERRKIFRADRKELVAALKKTKDETADDFALRKAFYEAHLDEFERLYVEAKELLIGGNIEPGEQRAHLDLEMTPLPGTALDASLKQAGEKPSRFAGVGRSENSILSARLNHPLDDMRQNYVLKIIEVLRTRWKNKADASDEYTAEQRDARKKLTDMVCDLLVETTHAGLVDGFIEAHANQSGKNTLVLGGRVAGGDKVIDILKLLPEASEGQAVELDVEKHAEVSIHKIAISQERHPDFVYFFGGPELYVGTQADALWCAAGENALAELKAAVTTASEPPADANQNRFASLFVKLAPWMDLRNRMAGDEEGAPKLRQMAIDAFALGEDTLDVFVERDGTKAIGELVAHPGFLRFAGKVIADFSKENLDEE